MLIDSAKSDPILNGVEPFEAYSWLYHVDGGEWSINPNTRWLLKARSLRSKHEAEGRPGPVPDRKPGSLDERLQGREGLLHHPGPSIRLEGGEYANTCLEWYSLGVGGRDSCGGV